MAANGLELNGASIVNKETTVAAVLAHDAVQGGDIRTRSVEGIAVTSEARGGCAGRRRGSTAPARRWSSR